MSPGVHFDFDEVGKLAGRLNQAVSELGQGRIALDQAPAMSDSTAGFTTLSQLAPSAVPSARNAFGNTQNAGALSLAYTEMHSAGQAATHNVGTTLTSDAKRLGQVINIFRRNDEDLADRACAATAGKLDVYATHVHSTGSEDNDAVRAGQLDKLRNVFNAHPGVLGVDANTVKTARNPSGEAINRFTADGNRIDGGDVGGTSPSGSAIDYVITAPGVIPEHARRVEGHPSDHDGQLLDITPPRW